jgi:hypothetical protein
VSDSTDLLAEAEAERVENARLIELVRKKKVALTNAATGKPPLRHLPYVLLLLLVVTGGASAYRWNHLPTKQTCWHPPDSDILTCAPDDCFEGPLGR